MLALVMAAMLMGTGEVDFEEEHTVKVTQINRYVVEKRFSAGVMIGNRRLFGDSNKYIKGTFGYIPLSWRWPAGLELNM